MAEKLSDKNMALIERCMMGLFRVRYLEMLRDCPEFGLLLDAARDEGRHEIAGRAVLSGE